MASQLTRSKTRLSDPHTAGTVKRKSNSNHNSPTTPSTSTMKQSLTQNSNTTTKTQTKLKAILESKEQSRPIILTDTKSTGMLREIKKEKMDATTKTTQSEPNSIVLSSPEEDELYSSIKYDETLDTSTKPISDKLNTNYKATGPKPSPSRSTKPGRGGRALVPQGRGGRAGGSIAPPSSKSKRTPVTSTPINLTDEFEGESDAKESAPVPTGLKEPTSDPKPIEIDDQNSTGATFVSDITKETDANTTSQSTTEPHSTEKPKQSPKPSNLKESKYKGKVQTNLSGSPINSVRYSMNFPVTQDQKGTKGMREALLVIFSAMKELCPDVTILPWKDTDKKESIKTPDGLPTTITQLQKYFDGARPLMASGRIYTKIHLGYAITSDRETFQNDFDGWCKDADIKFYRATVQHYNVKTICWLAYLTNHTNCELLSRVMTDAFKASTGKSVEIGLSWRLLNNQKDVAKPDKVYAVHVECPYDSATIVKRFLRSCSHQKIYPGGTKFRVINEYWPYMTEPNKKKYRYMKDKHKYFLDQIGLCSTAQPLEIDRRIPGTKTTIRQALLSIRDKQDNHRVFHSIDIRWNSSSIYNVTYRPDKKAMAYMYCNSLSTYVHHCYPKADLSKLFPLDAIDKAYEETYDVATQTFVTQEDIAMQMEVNNDRDDDSLEWGDFSQIRQIDDDDSEATPSVEMRNPRLFDLSGETESVSTIGNSVSSVQFQEDDIETENENDAASAISAKSNTTEQSTTSQRTRMETLETSHKQTSNDVAALRGEVNSFIALMKQNMGLQPEASTLNEEQASGSK